MAELPHKESYRLSEVCEFTDTQPYVLRFWESEFPQLNPARSRSGQPVYSRADIDLVQRIKRLLHEEEYTLADARRKLEQGDDDEPPKRARRGTKRSGDESTAPPAERRGAPERAASRPLPLEPDPSDVIDKERYDAAVEEIEHLRYRLKQTERELRVADERRDAAEARAGRAIERLEALVRELDTPTDPAP